MIRVVRGNPTPEELAAAVAVVQARAAATASAAEDGGAGESAATAWADPAARLGRPLPQPGPSAWRTTFWAR
ncbi:acyl-CoA carboxylase epsilon subunit [Streptomyces sp. NPDC059740]|uniref:acyl-CoA carboxylase epsilon subunit n=1 Tax=Streptomyces sp. NPDC059740 TaxID=3346926 RepID=UPI00365FB839